MNYVRFIYFTREKKRKKNIFSRNKNPCCIVVRMEFEKKIIVNTRENR